MKDATSDIKFYALSSTIITVLIFIGAALESTFLFRTGLGLILVVPLLRVTFKKYAASKGTSSEDIRKFQFIAETAMGVLFLIGLSASSGGLVKVSFLGLVASSLAEGIIKKYE